MPLGSNPGGADLTKLDFKKLGKAFGTAQGRNNAKRQGVALKVNKEQLRKMKLSALAPRLTIRVKAFEDEDEDQDE